MKKILIILFLSFVLIGCSTKTEKIQKLMQENEYIIIDVRTNDEYNESHLVDAINIPYDKINETTELDKKKLIFVYCQSGNRSKIAYNTLSKLGYNVYDMGAYSKIKLSKE